MSIKQIKQKAAAKQRIISWFWKLLGITLIVIAVVCAVLVMGSRSALREYNVFGGLNSALFAMMAVLFGSIGVVCFNHGRKLTVLSAETLISQDTRPPVLYLRSFNDDVRAASIPHESAVSNFLQMLVGTTFSMRTEEEEIASVMSSIGPFIAIGKPGEKLPQLGAARTYLASNLNSERLQKPQDTSYEDWQEAITHFMSAARLVVLRLGEGEGFWWEVQRACELVPPEKLLILIPDDWGLYDYFRRKAKNYLPIALPEYPNPPSAIGTSIKSLIYFERNWTPHFISLRASLVHAIMYGSNLKSTLKMSLRPVFEQLNADWTRPSKWSSPALKLACVPIVTGVVTLLYFIIAQPKPFEEGTPKYLRRIAANPEIRRVFQGLSQSQANTLGRELGGKGLARLDDSMLLERAALVHKLLIASDTTSCIAFVRGNLQESQIEEALKKLEPSDVAAFSSMIEQAVLAEIRHSPDKKAVTDDEFTGAAKALFSDLPNDQVRDVKSLLFGDSSNLSDEDACRAARQLYEKVVNLREPHRRVFLRFMVND